MNAANSSFVGPNVTAARDFTRHLADLLRKEHGAMVSFLLALNECDGKRLWADLGYASLFDFLHRELKLSRSAAYYRAAAAGLVLKYPDVADALADGRLCLTSLAEISKVITPANAAGILPRFFHRSSREAKEVAAEIAPHPAPPRREVFTALRVATREPATIVGRRSDESPSAVQALGQMDTFQAGPAAVPGPGRGTVSAAVPACAPVQEAPLRREDVEPLTADLRRFHVTASKRWMEKLNSAKAALSHSVPSGSAEEVLETALDALLEREAKRKGLVKNPRIPPTATEDTRASMRGPSIPQPVLSVGTGGLGVERLGTNGAAPVPTSKRHRKAVPSHVRREVSLRDDAKCQAKLHDGTICGSRVRLQFDHVTPDSLGGPTTVENGRILCSAHNQLAARKIFGDPIMDLFAHRERRDRR